MSATFGWAETPARLRQFAEPGEPTLDSQRRVFVRPDGAEFHPPPIARPGDDTRDVDDFLREWPERLPSMCLVLLRAGATALGRWDAEELVAHKVIKKYVVRGNGKAQRTHLSTKGKSRYGSRLRLQNARRQLEETNERLVAWWGEFGVARTVIYAAPDRLWSDLFEARPAPPFEKREAWRVTMHTHTPGFEELKRVRRWTLRGRVVERTE